MRAQTISRAPRELGFGYPRGPSARQERSFSRRTILEEGTMATATAKKTTKTKSKKSSGKGWGGISDEAVLKATGCDWKAWHWHLDASGCAKMTHKEIAEFVHKRW